MRSGKKKGVLMIEVIDWVLAGVAALGVVVGLALIIATIVGLVMEGDEE